MAKLRKSVVKRKRDFNKFAIGLLIISLFLYFFSSVFIENLINNYTMDIQNMTNEISNLKNENQTLNIEIQSLQNKERVYLIAQESGMNQNDDNVVSVVVED